MSEAKKQLKDFGENAREVIGIKITTSKTSGKQYYTYFCHSNHSDYDMENADEIKGIACEEVGSSVDLGLDLGDIVEFNYGKANGKYQPIKSVDMLQPAAFINFGKENK